MTTHISPDAVYVPSRDIVAREIEGEIIIVPLTAGIGDMADELFTLNETGKAVWKRLNGKQTLRELIASMADEFEAAAGEIEKDVTGLVAEFLKRKIIIEAASD